MERQTKLPEILTKGLLLKILQNPMMDVDIRSIINFLKGSLKQGHPNAEDSIIKQIENEELIQRIQDHLGVLSRKLKKIPYKFAHLLMNDGIQSETYTIIINSSATITKIYKQIVRQINNEINQNIPEKLDFEEVYIQTSTILIAQIINKYACIIVDCFNEGKQQIKTWVHKIEQQLKKCQIMNTYIVFALLKQMAKYTHESVCQVIKKSYLSLSEEEASQFCKYIQSNYEILNIENLKDGQNCIFNQQEQQQFYLTQNQKWLKFIQDHQSNEIKLKKIQSIQGFDGILLERKSLDLTKSLRNKQSQKIQQDHSNDHTQKLIIKVEDGNHIKVINARICQKSWKIFHGQNSIQGLHQLLKQNLQKNSSKKGKQYASYGVPTCGEATIGGSLGKCLANIDKYNNANQFFIDVSKTTAIYGTISFIMYEIPIISYFIIAGGFSYSFYITCKNEATSTIKKAQIIGNNTITAVGSIGSTVGGILLGQALIPVPFLGAFVGGVLGGFIGTKGAKEINQFIYKKNFQQMILYLRSEIVQGKHWIYTNSFLEKIGLDIKYFNNHKLLKEYSKDVCLTAICFCIVSFYESKRYVQYNQKMTKQVEQRSKRDQQNRISKQNFQIIVTETQQQQKQLAFINQFNIVAIIDFLAKENFRLIMYLEELQGFILHII